MAFAGKRVTPRTSLGALTFAAQFLDELWPILLLLGVEQVRIVPGLMAANPLDRLDLSLGRAVAYVCGGVVNGRAGLTDLIAVLAIFGLSAWAMVWVSRKLFSGTP